MEGIPPKYYSLFLAQVTVGVRIPKSTANHVKILLHSIQLYITYFHFTPSYTPPFLPLQPSKPPTSPHVPTAAIYNTTPLILRPTKTPGNDSNTTIGVFTKQAFPLS